VIAPGVLPEAPYAVFAAGRQAPVPILVGANAAEARAFLAPAEIRAATFAKDLAARFGPLPPQIVAAYPFQTDEEARAARVALETDLRFGWDMWAWARLHAASGVAPAYAYRFEQAPPFPTASPYANWGPAHFAELWYMFGRLDQESWDWTDGDRRLSKTMLGYWANFARRGDPNGPGLPPWPAFHSEGEAVMALRDPVAVTQVQRRPQLQVFEAAYGALRGQSSR
jgi:para-nitrobenzyl esterase